MLVHPGYSNTTVPDGTYTFIECLHGRFRTAWESGLVRLEIGNGNRCFTDNEIMYDRAFRYITKPKAGNDDLNYEPGPPITYQTASIQMTITMNTGV